MRIVPSHKRGLGTGQQTGGGLRHDACFVNTDHSDFQGNRVKKLVTKG